MSGRKYSHKKNLIKDLISVEDVILEYVIDNRWKDYQKFARKLSERILEKQPLTKHDLNLHEKYVSRTSACVTPITQTEHNLQNIIL